MTSELSDFRQFSGALGQRRPRRFGRCLRHRYHAEGEGADRGGAVHPVTVHTA